MIITLLRTCANHLCDALNQCLLALINYDIVNSANLPPVRKSID